MSPNNSNARVALVTGCSAGGIGYFLALELAANGCQVYAAVRDTGKATELKESGIAIVEMDVTRDDSVQPAVQKVIDEAGRIDILINNAGLMCTGPVTDTDLQLAQTAFDTNVLGVARVCQAVAPHMIKQHSGLIANVGSVSGYAATPWVGFYGATKAAVHTLSDAMRVELASFNVKVVVVAPGAIRSNLATHHEVALPENSPFMPALPAIRDRAVFSQTGNPTPTDKFAKVVVAQLLSRSPAAYITYGNHSKTTWLLYYAPPFVKDWLYSRRFGVSSLKEARSLCPVRQASSSCCPFSNPLLLLGFGALAAYYFFSS
ncbi:Rossmann-fold NAD(P)-binding domain-containing protein [Coemansia mojavensis]|nr:Rossmann-fold NAD(P)-binding domain-containing protein [Coemansia mojavensis]